MAITKNRVAIDIDIDKGNLIKRVRKFIFNILDTSLSITKYALIVWLVFVLTINAMAFLEIALPIFDQFHFNEWVEYQAYNFVENTAGLGYMSNWIPVESACETILYEPINESWIGDASNITEQKNGTWVPPYGVFKQ
jgi:hypothetical protein